MANDNHLSALLPDPPPPRPARREEAIELALRRFDGAGAGTAQPVGGRAAPARAGWGRPQIAALASVALVVMISVPIWWAEKDRLVPDAPRIARPVAQGEPGSGRAPRPASPPQAAAADPKAASTEGEDAVPPATDATPPITPPLDIGAAPAPTAFADARLESEAPAQAPQRQVAAPSPVAAARPAAARTATEESIVVTGSRIERRDYNTTTPMVTVDAPLLSDGDWNTCTLLDPRRDVGSCRAIADPAAPGANGRAAAQLADGLAFAWQGDLDRAIDAFDRAIGAEPDLAVAYLNRGLAYQAKGNLRRALADLNRAVSREPDSARAYYHRSLLHRARDDTARAEADAKRAIELDPAYRAALP